MPKAKWLSAPEGCSRGWGSQVSSIQIQFDLLPLKGGRTRHRDARLVREMFGLTSMAWDDKYAHYS